MIQKKGLIGDKISQFVFFNNNQTIQKSIYHFTTTVSPFLFMILTLVKTKSLLNSSISSQVQVSIKLASSR